MKARPLYLSLIALVFLAIPKPECEAQVVVYKFDFHQEGPSLNYGFYDEGWVVADAIGGPASWALTFREGALRYYITVTDFGSLFYPRDGKIVAGVISAAAASGTPQTTFLAIGDADTTVAGGNIAVKVPRRMEGYAQSADDESELPFDEDEDKVGYAGISRMEGSLQPQRTEDSNNDNLTVAETLAELVAYLERRGYVEFVVEDPADDTTDTGDGTTDPGDGTATDPGDGTTDTGDGTTDTGDGVANPGDGTTDTTATN